MRSIRNSNYGYVNAPDVHISFSPLEQYVTDLENAVGSGQLSAEKELYSAARLRGAKTSRDFLPKCISYLEFRLEQQGYTPIQSYLKVAKPFCVVILISQLEVTPLI